MMPRRLSNFLEEELHRELDNARGVQCRANLPSRRTIDARPRRGKGRVISEIEELTPELQ